MTRALPALLLLAGPALAGCGAATSGDPPGQPEARLVLVSGRDDHGLVAEARVPVYAGPASSQRVGNVPDGTLARVAGSDGPWLHVVTAEGARVDGWVDDFFLRGVVHLVGPPPSCRAMVGGRAVTGGLQVVVRRLRGDRVLVTGVEDPAIRGWSARGDVQELGPQPPHCGQDPLDAPHHHD